MKVNYEFLDSEPIENIITCLNYVFERVVYFGYPDVIARYQKTTEKFLKKYCNVRSVEFVPVDYYDINSVSSAISRAIEDDINNGGEIYCDITGGDSIVMTAFGMYAQKHNLPIHYFDVKSNSLVEYGNGEGHYLSKDVTSQTVTLDIKRYIEMYGGAINPGLHKDFKGNLTPSERRDFELTWEIAYNNWDSWNPLSDFLRKIFDIDDTTLRAVADVVDMSAEYSNNKKIKSMTDFSALIEEFRVRGLVTDVNCSGGYYSFRFKNKDIKQYIWESGSVLEMHIYLENAGNSDDCMVGVHIDWDGEISPDVKQDVYNEVDVLVLKGNIMTFTSCKSGNVDGKALLSALYELKTVSDRLGGKYSKRVLAVVKNITHTYRERAAEMGIEIKKYSNI